MKENEVLKDLLDYKITSQLLYNENLIKIRNPEVRQIFTQFRDDEMRSIIRLQQKIERMETPPGIVAKFFTSKGTH